MRTIVGRTNKAIGSPITRPSADVIAAIHYLNDEFDGGEIVFERAQLVVKPRRGLRWPFQATPIMRTKFSRYEAAFDTRCRSGSRSSNATHWQIFRRGRR